MHPATFTRSIVIMSGVWRKPGQAPPVLCTRQNIRVPISMPSVTRRRIYTSMAGEGLMCPYKHDKASKNRERRRLVQELHTGEYLLLRTIRGWTVLEQRIQRSG